jgi:hypothetical protein
MFVFSSSSLFYPDNRVNDAEARQELRETKEKKKKSFNIHSKLSSSAVSSIDGAGRLGDTGTFTVHRIYPNT